MDSGSKLHAVPWVIRVLGSRLWMVAALVGLEVVIAGGGVYTAWVMRGLVNAAVGGASYALRLSVVVFAAVSAALIALRALYRFLQERARTMFQNILRLRFLGKVLHAELSSVQAVHTGEWMSRLTDGAYRGIRRHHGCAFSGGHACPACWIACAARPSWFPKSLGCSSPRESCSLGSRWAFVACPNAFTSASVKPMDAHVPILSSALTACLS